MPVVIAQVHPKPGRLPEVLSAYREAVPLIHQEQGCELFAVHTNGESIFIVERWATDADLQGHAQGAVYARIRSLIDDMVARRADIWKIENIPLGAPAKGTIQ